MPQGKYEHNRNIELIIITIFLIQLLLISWATFASGVAKAETNSIMRRQTAQVGFQGQWQEITVVYTFGADGGLTVEDSRGSLFYFPAPKFQPSFAPVVDLSENERYVIQHFWVNGSTVNPQGNAEIKTLDLHVYYDFTVYQIGTKISLVGATTDPDSEVEYEFKNPKGTDIASNSTSYQIGYIIFDWSDLQGTTSFEFAVNRLKIKFASAFNLDPSIVSTTNTLYATSYEFQRKLAYGATRWWPFYSTSTNFYYRSSIDGGAWSDATLIGAGTGYECSIWQENATVTHYIRRGYYREGTLQTNGIIGWAAAEQHIVSEDVDYPSIAVDSSGYPYVAYHTSSDNVEILKSSTKGGTWTNASGYPVTFNSVISGLLLPLLNNKMVLVYQNFTMWASWYNGVSWQAPEQVSSLLTPTNGKFSGVSSGNTAYIIFRDTAGDLYLTQKTYAGTWSTPSLVIAGIVGSFSLSKTGSSLYVFFIKNNLHVYMNVTATTWQSFGSWPESSATYCLNSLYSETANKELGCIYTRYDLLQVKFLRITTQPPEIPEVEISSGVKPSTTTEKPIEVEEKPFVLPQFGLYGLLGAVGLITIGGVIAYVDQPKARRRGKSSYRPSQPQRSYYHKPLSRSQTYRRIKQ